MKRAGLIYRNEKGFLILALFLMMVLMAITAVALNRSAGLQTRMAANQTRAIQVYFDHLATIEATVWGLTLDPCWRTSASGEDYAYNGTTYNRKVRSSTIGGYSDAFTVTCAAPGAQTAITTSFRYCINSIDSPFLDIEPRKVSCDSSDNIYFADSKNHTVWKLDAITGAMTVVAGNGTSGFSGDGGPATSAQLDKPYGVFADNWGNIFIADTDNSCIRKVNLLGNISTVAGTGGSDGYSGDGGSATSAELKKPNDVHVHFMGNIYIADTDNHCIRRVDAASGNISTVAGTGAGGFTGDGGLATSAKLKNPSGVFVDASGDIYIADTENHCIRRVEAASGNINTVAGTGGSEGYTGDEGLATSAELKRPNSVCVDTSGNIYIADTENHAIRMVDAGGTISTIAGTGSAGYTGDGGPATNAQLDKPGGVCLTGTGKIIIADTMNACLRQVDLIGFISTITDTGIPGLNAAEQIAIDAGGNVYIADKGNHRIRKLDTSGWITTVAGTGSAGDTGDGGPATNAEVDQPNGVYVDTAGNIFIADTNSSRIRKVDASTGIITTVAGDGHKGFQGDGELAVGNSRVDKPSGVFVDASGDIYIADTENHCIRKIDTSGIINTVAGQGKTKGYSGDGGPATNAEMDTPHSIAVDAAGNIYIADTENHCIRKVDTSGIINTIAGQGGTNGYSGDGGPATSALLNKPEQVFVDSAGNIFIADTENHVIRLVNTHDSTIKTLVGVGGSKGYNGDDQPAVTAQLDTPKGVTMAAIRGGGSIFISDTDNNRIRVLKFNIVRELY